MIKSAGDPENDGVSEGEGRGKPRLTGTFALAFCDSGTAGPPLTPLFPVFVSLLLPLLFLSLSLLFFQGFPFLNAIFHTLFQILL